MNKCFCLIMCICFLFSFCCGFSEDNTTVSVIIDGLSVSVPADWEYSDSKTERFHYHYFYNGEVGDIENGYLMLYTEPSGNENANPEQIRNLFKAFTINVGSPNIEYEEYEVSGLPGMTWNGDLNINDEMMMCYGFAFYHGKNVLMGVYLNPSKDEAENKKELCHFADSIQPVFVNENDGTFDLDDLNYEELIDLKDQINKAMWDSEEWQEVTVPIGAWKVGEDIPAGHWTIKAAEGARSSIYWCTKLNSVGKRYGSNSLLATAFVFSPTNRLYNEYDKPTEVDFDIQDGEYIVIEDGNAVFTPYQGKPSLGFK